MWWFKSHQMLFQRSPGGGENKNSVLVTGASGFLGKAITSKLADKPQFTVYAVTSGRRSVSFPATVKTVAANLLDREACRKLIQETQPSIMCHLAWGLVDSKFLISPDNICWLETGLQLLSLFKEHGGRRFVFAGSSAEYGYENSICKEDEQGNPSDLYGVCKAAFTAVAAKFCADNGMEFVSARIFSVYGAGETHLLHAVPVAIDALMRGNVFVCKSPNNIWDYIYIDDAAAATVMLLESDFCGIINIASGVGSTMREVFTTIAEQLGKESLLSFENEDLPGLMLVADTAVLNEIIGFSCNYDLHEGLKQTIGWRQKQQ